MMTEKEAWLELAKVFGSDKPLPVACGLPIFGICPSLWNLVERGVVTLSTKHDMKDRLNRYFNPNGIDIRWNFFWPEDVRRPTRDLRATACCFLAAMCEEER